MGINVTDFVELLWELNEIVYVKLTVQHTKCKTSVLSGSLEGTEVGFFTAC